MPANDREQELQRLATENARWAEAELQLIEAIQQHKRRLKRLPEIIRLLPGIIQGLKEEQRHVMSEMLRTGAEHDALEAEGATNTDRILVDWTNDEVSLHNEPDAKFHTWADDMADDDCPVPCDGCEAALERDEVCPSEGAVYDAKFHAWASDMADDYADFQLTVQPPRPTRLGYSGGNMPYQEIADSTLCRDYVCGKCLSTLTMRWSEDEGSYVECIACGRRVDFVKKATIEHYDKVRSVGAYELKHNPAFAKFLPDNMRPDVPDAETCLEELFGD